MGKWFVALLLGSLVVALSACEYDQIAPTPPRLPTATPIPTIEMVTLAFYNDSSETICTVYASSLSSETWGDNLLGGEAAAPGDARTFDVPAGEYVLRIYDCDGNALVTEGGVDLYHTAEWRLNDAVIAGGLDLEKVPRFGEADLDPGFAPDPYTVVLTGGGDVEVALLNLGADCAGYASSAPDFRLNWWGDSGRVRIFFVADGGESATLIVGDPDEVWLCKDGLDPLIEIESAVSGQYDIWVGGHSLDEGVGGTLYITGLDYSPGNLP